MRKSTFSESQIIGILKEVESGGHVKDFCRERCISDATYYQLKSKFGGMGALDISHLRELGDGSHKLKLMVADLTGGPGDQGSPESKEVSPDEWRWTTAQLQLQGLSQLTACRAVPLSRSVFAYERQTEPDEPIIVALQELAERYLARGVGKYFTLIRQCGHGWNHKRVYRVYSTLGLNRRRVGKIRLPPRDPGPLAVRVSANHSWSMYFMSDELWCGRRFRNLNVADDFNREVLAIKIDLNLPVSRLVRVLERIAAWRGYPAKIRVDNGPEFIAATLVDWVQQHGVALESIRPGRPMQNGFIERFNLCYREAALDMHVFKTLEEVRELKETWMADYNEVLPHGSLGAFVPVEYRALHHPETSSNGGH